MDYRVSRWRDLDVNGSPHWRASCSQTTDSFNLIAVHWRIHWLIIAALRFTFQTHPVLSLLDQLKVRQQLYTAMLAQLPTWTLASVQHGTHRQTHTHKQTVQKAADEESKLLLTFELLKRFLSLLVAAELDETLQHSHRVVSKRHLEAGEQSGTVRTSTSPRCVLNIQTSFYYGLYVPKSQLLTCKWD